MTRNAATGPSMTGSPSGPDRNLVLFTAAYPHTGGAERNFLRPELPYLLKAFRRVILVPERPSGELDADLPDVEVQTGYAEYLRAYGRNRTFFRGLRSRLVYGELRLKPRLLIRPAFLKRLLFFAGQAELTSSWLTRWLRDRRLQPASCLLYTYWFDQATLGIGLTKDRLPALKVITRAHGYDVYEQRQPVPFFPCREAAFERVDRVFPVSEAGARHLSAKYPRFASKIEMRRLGVENPGVLTGPSTDGTCRVVSCSTIVPVKRLPLMLEGIRAAAQRRPAQRFQWSHLGNGTLPPELEAAKQRLPSNLSVSFLPYASQAALFKYYRHNCIDVFLNVSASEGIPMSIMEAISCGIPVVATAVGGNAEVVSEQNGCLIVANPSPDQIAEALLACCDGSGQRRSASRELWSRSYDASRNYPDFVQRLLDIRK